MDASEVGRLVMTVERAVGVSDCYPRALLTAYLCMTARLPCQVSVGIWFRPGRCTLGAPRRGQFPTSPNLCIGGMPHSWSSMSAEETTAGAARPHPARVLAPETVSGCTSSFEVGSLLLEVRAAVAMRQVAERKQTLFYLCLFDDEIDSRLEAFQAFNTPALWTEQHLAAAALKLEPTDAVVIACRQGEILVARGGASNFPLYWTTTADKILVSTVLPVGRGQPLSRTGLLSSVTVVALANQNEPNLSVQTPLAGWFRCRRGAVSRLSSSAGCVSERLVDLAESGDTEFDQEALLEALRSALDQFGQSDNGVVVGPSSSCRGASTARSLPSQRGGMASS